MGDLGTRLPQFLRPIKASCIFSTLWKFCNRWQLFATHLFCQQIDRYRREAEETKNRLYEYEADSQRKQQENALENEKVHNLCHPWTRTLFRRLAKKSEQSWVWRSSGAKLRKRCGRVARTFYSVYSYFKWCKALTLLSLFYFLFFTISGKNEIATKTSRTRTIGRFTQGKSYDRSVILGSLVQWLFQRSFSFPSLSIHFLD